MTPVSESKVNSAGMLFIEDRGSLFDASLGTLWKYLDAGQEHDKAHKSTRNSSFKPLSNTSFIFSSERNMSGQWVQESLRIAAFQPLAMATEMLEGPFAGSKMFYVYSPKGSKTQIDVFGEFKPGRTELSELEQTVRRFLEREYNDDTPVIRAFAEKVKQPATGDMVYIEDLGSQFEAPIDVVWKYFSGEGGHGKAHKHIRNAEIKDLSETTSIFTSERRRNGDWVRESTRVTVFYPLGVVFEMLEGPHAGSVMLYVYTPKGDKTQIDVYGYFKSGILAADRLKQEVLAENELEFNDDAPYVKGLGQKK